MTVIVLPEGFCPNQFSMRLAPVQRVHSSPFGGSEQVVDLLNDRWMASLSLPNRRHSDAARIEAFVAAMRGMTNTVSLRHFARPVPRGTLRGSPTVFNGWAQGVDYIFIQTVVGATLLAGDLIGIDGLLLMVAADTATDPVSARMGIPLANRLRRAITSGMPVVWDRPTAPFRLMSPSFIQYVPGYADSVSLDFAEAIA